MLGHLLAQNHNGALILLLLALIVYSAIGFCVDGIAIHTDADKGSKVDPIREASTTLGTEGSSLPPTPSSLLPKDILLAPAS